MSADGNSSSYRSSFKMTLCNGLDSVMWIYKNIPPDAAGTEINGEAAK
jgi:hypothetical protein